MDSFDLFWTVWNVDASAFRGRHLLVLQSLLVHHPAATVIVLSSTLDDITLFLPFRQRGYRISSFNISIARLLRWQWYVDDRSKEFLRHWNSNGSFFQSHLLDYLRTMVLYLYGGTFIDMDLVVLQPLPAQEFLADQQCPGCVMRFRPRRPVFLWILQNRFNREVYDETCLDCVGSRVLTDYLLQENSPLLNLTLYPVASSNASALFHQARADTPLQLAALIKQSYSIHLFGQLTHGLSIARGSLVDLLLNRFDLGDFRLKVSRPDSPSSESARFIHPSIYVDTRRTQGRFIGRDLIYLRSNREISRWNLTIHVANGTVFFPTQRSLSQLNQAEINLVLNQMRYKPRKGTSIDTLTIDASDEKESVRCSVRILVFHRWVSVLTKTMGTEGRWPVVQRLVASVERYFPQTFIHVASDSGEPIAKRLFLNSTHFDHLTRRRLSRTLAIHNLPHDSGLSACRNDLVDRTSTPFFFIVDDDFVVNGESHLDLLLELIYSHPSIDIIAGKIPEDMQTFHDYSGVFLRYNQTLELTHDLPAELAQHALFPRGRRNSDDSNPCRQVDFVPNAFLGRTRSVASVGWDEQFKVGEHEDFFIRFGQANRTVFTCPYIHVHHYQEPWWKKVRSPYYQQRARVYQFYQQMLLKHHLKRLITFDLLNMDLEEIARSSHL